LKLGAKALKFSKLLASENLIWLINELDTVPVFLNWNRTLLLLVLLTSKLNWPTRLSPTVSPPKTLPNPNVKMLEPALEVVEPVLKVVEPVLEVVVVEFVGVVGVVC
jgi:hypothetical protein